MRIIALAALILLGSCTSLEPIAPQQAFFQRLLALCGKTLEGRIVSPIVPADANFAGKRLVMHVRDCSKDEVRIPFQVGEDRSRTWLIRRTASGLELKHDHRHEDGSEDRLSQYGGTAIASGTPTRQEFPADAFSKALFERENSPASVANIWALEVEPPNGFVYELRRPNRFFRVEFSDPAAGVRARN